MTSPDALLFLTPSCPHCPAVLQALTDLVKAGTLGRLEIVNLAVLPAAGNALGVRSVPWVRIGHFELTGLRSRDELAQWAARASDPAALVDYFHDLLKDGGLSQVLDRLDRRPELLGHLLPILADPEAGINARLGASAAFEHFAATPALAALVPQLGALAAHDDARVRADACHILGLSADADARPFLMMCLEDASAEVREIAAESLEAIDEAAA